jgi:hypothetical protein
MALVVSWAKAGTAMAHIRAATAALLASILVDIMDTPSIGSIRPAACPDRSGVRIPWIVTFGVTVF